MFVDPSIGKIHDLFRYGKKAWTCLYIKKKKKKKKKKLYSDIAYIAFCENLHFSMEAHFILNKF